MALGPAAVNGKNFFSLCVSVCAYVCVCVCVCARACVFQLRRQLNAFEVPVQ